MSNRTSIATLLLLSALLLTGCNVHYGAGCRASQVTNDRIRTAGGQPEATSQTTQLREDLRVANERAKVAEEKAESERQKRESAEERLKQLESTDQEENIEDSSEDKETNGS